MGYPPQYPQQPDPQQGYGYQQAAPQGYGYQAPAAAGGYDFGGLFGQADFSGGLFEDGDYPAVVESSEYGTTKAGDKGQWTVVVRLTNPPDPNLAGRKLTGNITISPKTKDGADNGFGIGRMFSELAALGVAVPDPKTPSVVLNGDTHGGVPFWIDPQTRQPLPRGVAEQQAAQVMVGKPCRVHAFQNRWDGGVNMKIQNFMPNPGGATTWAQQQAQPNPWAGGTPQPPQGYGQAGPPPVQPPQPGYPPQPQAPAYGQPPVPGQPQAPQPWGVTQQAAQPPQGQPPVPGAPPWAQPGQPGQGGYGEFTQGGQSQQAPPPPQGPPAGPPAPPWAQGNGGPQQPQQVPPGQPGQQGGAPLPPWAQQ